MEGEAGVPRSTLKRDSELYWDLDNPNFGLKKGSLGPFLSISGAEDGIRTRRLLLGISSVVGMNARTGFPRCTPFEGLRQHGVIDHQARVVNVRIAVVVAVFGVERLI